MKKTRKCQNHKKQNPKEYANINKSAINMENTANNPATKKKNITPLTHIWIHMVYINKTAKYKEPSNKHQTRINIENPTKKH